MSRVIRQPQRFALAACLCISLAGTVPAQEDNPAGADPAGEAAPTIDVPINGSLLAKEPSTPIEYVDAALLMIDLARPQLSKAYLGKLLSSNPDDATLLEIRDHFGPGPLARLGNLKELRPESTTLLDKINAASKVALSDPDRLSKLIAQLASEDESQRATAHEALRSAAETAVPGILAALADANRSPLHQELLQILVEMGDLAVPPLLGGLEAPDTMFRSQAITALGHLRAQQAVRLLWYPAVAPEVPTAESASALVALARILDVPAVKARSLAMTGAVEELHKVTRELFRDRLVPVEDADPQIVWGWDEAQSAVVPLNLTPEQLRDRLAERLGQQLLALAPERRDVQTLQLAILLARDGQSLLKGAGLPKGAGTVADTAQSVGAERVGDALALALDEHRGEAALAALAILERIATVGDIAGPSSTRESPVVRALNAPDRRVQFAAARTILQIDPSEQFPESSRVVEILVRALAGENELKAVIVHPSAEKGTRFSGQMSELGFNPLLFNAGTAGFKEVVARNDVAVVVLHANMIRWPVSETLANLRADSRSKGIPVILVGDERTAPALRKLGSRYDKVTVVNETQTAADLELQAKPMFRGIRNDELTESERLSQRNEALLWLDHLANTRRYKVFPIERAEKNLLTLLNEPELVATGLGLVGEIPSEACQQALADMALQESQTPENRVLASRKLAFHIQRFGLLATNEQISGLEAAWANEATPELRDALGSVIGSLKPDAILAGKRLKSAR
jgi:HEAT repeat protein